ncbi:MAG: homoprotocatechuate degradation operon regulator HpaR [Gammaproteobacteria bacterium]|nr:homoprotocatechuate degradation operon regulator HpaR [Gammaproteobacteria bacterium]
MTRLLHHRNLPLMLLQAREAVLAQFRPILTRHGLTEQQWRVIRFLDEHDELESWQVAAQCQILKPSLTGVLTRLEQMGLVERRRSPADQRRLLVATTHRCKALIRRIAPLIEARYAQLEQALGSELVADLYDNLDRVLAMRFDAAPRADDGVAG